MCTPVPDSAPRSDSPVWISRFEWPSLETELRVPGMGFGPRLVNRANGEAGISPVPAPDETEISRFMATFFRAVFPAGADGLPLSDPAGTGELKEICAGGAEVLLTDARMAVVMVKGWGVYGKVENESGSVVVVDVPYRALGSVELVRKRRISWRVKDVALHGYTTLPAGVIQLEPFARMDPDLGNPRKVRFVEFMDDLVQAACTARLSATLMEKDERNRLERVRDGERVAEGLDVVAELEG